MKHIEWIGLAVISCSAAVFPAAAQAQRLLEEYSLESQTGIPQTPVRVPEGVAFDPLRGDFFATGIFGGRITRIDARTGDETTLFQETEDPGLAFGGIKIAPIRRVAWVCAVDLPSLSSLPTSSVYAIRVPGRGEGRLLRRVELPPPFFCNDLALDFSGNVYVTNSFGDAVMKISPRALWDDSVGAEVFVQSPLLAPVPVEGVPPLTANGLAVTPDNRSLIVARAAPAQLLRMSLDDPSDIAPVVMSGDAFAEGVAGAPGAPGAPDGLVFVGGRLYVVFIAGVQQLTFTGGCDYAEAQVSTTTAVPFGITTAANAWGRLYVIDADIQALNPGPGVPIELPHRILRVDSAQF